MPDFSYPPQRPLAVAEILELAYRIYRGTLVSCLTFATLGAIGGQIPDLYVLVQGRGLAAARSPEELMALIEEPRFLMAVLAGMLLTAYFYCVVLLRQYRLLTGAGRGGEMTSVLGRLPALIVLAALVSAALNACLLPAVLADGLARALLALLGLSVLGYLVVAVSCAHTVLLTEHRGPLASFLESWRLTSGNFWRLSWLYTLYVLLVIVLYLIFGAIGGALAALVGATDSGAGAAMIAVTVVAVGTLITPFFAAMGLVVLADLKVRREAGARSAGPPRGT